MSENLGNVERIPKKHGMFTNYIFKSIPLAFDESMSYYETLCALLSYLKDTVTPTVNNNADVLQELQDYVVHYFDNLDVQEEINNKLDDMAESGQLEEIISAYLDANTILAFNNVSALKSATNLLNGSFARTYGKNSYNDGLGSLYKIRTLTNNDVVDEINILSLTNFEGLIAEKIYKRTPFNDKKYLFVGDSLAWGYQGANVDPIEGFFEKVVDKFNLNAEIVCFPRLWFRGCIKWLYMAKLNNKQKS